MPLLLRACPASWCFSISGSAAGRGYSCIAGFPVPGQHLDSSQPKFAVHMARTCTHLRSVSEMQLLWLSRFHHRLAQILKQTQLLLKLCSVCVLDVGVLPLHVVT